MFNDLDDINTMIEATLKKRHVNSSEASYESVIIQQQQQYQPDEESWLLSQHIVHHDNNNNINDSENVNKHQVSPITAMTTTSASYEDRNNNNNNDNLDDTSYHQPFKHHREERRRRPCCFFRVFSCTCLLILLLIACTGIGFVQIQQQIQGITDILTSQQQQIQFINDKLQQHEIVIGRFNSSISNNDVINQLNILQQNVTATTIYLLESLQTTQETIKAQLDITQLQLNATVDEAERIIQAEVIQVRTDVDQYVAQTQSQFSMENSFMVYQLAGTFTVLSCLISMWHMTAHIRKLNQPDVQRKILAILWMSPIYAITSWFSLVFPSAEGWLAIVKDGYEGYVIYQFLSFCIAVIGKGDRQTVVQLLAEHADHLKPPYRLFSCLDICTDACKPEPYDNPRSLADAILLQCQFFAMQFVFLRPLTTCAMVILKKMDYYGPPDSSGPWDYRSPQFYIMIVQNVSIFMAFSGLLKFYHAVDQELAWCRPFAKFMCIKGVVFMTFWQGVAISILAHTTDFLGGNMDDIQEDEYAKGAQNFLICLEMLLFSIAHFYCFPIEEWEEGYRVKHTPSKFGDTVALGDFMADLKLLLTTSSDGGSTSKRRKKQVTNEQHRPPTIPEVDNEDTESIISTNTVDTTSVFSVNSNNGDDEEERTVNSNGTNTTLDDAIRIAQARERILSSKDILLPSDDNDSSLMLRQIIGSLSFDTLSSSASIDDGRTQQQHSASLSSTSLITTILSQQQQVETMATTTILDDSSNSSVNHVSLDEEEGQQPILSVGIPTSPPPSMMPPPPPPSPLPSCLYGSLLVTDDDHQENSTS